MAHLVAIAEDLAGELVSNPRPEGANSRFKDINYCERANRSSKGANPRSEGANSRVKDTNFL